MTAIVRRTSWSVVTVLLILALAGCAASDRPSLGVSNGTTLVVTITVNGLPVATVEPGAPSPTFSPGTLPGLPWTVEARAPSGRVLTSMTVEHGEIQGTANPDGSGSSQGTFGRVDLSCGRLTIWAGDREPSGPAPVAPAGQAGDCAP